MKHILVSLLVLFSAVITCAQNTKQLSKKETKEFINQIRSSINIGDYETSINIYQTTKENIFEKNVPKSDMDWWKKTKTDLDNKYQLFNKNEEVIVTAKKFFTNQEYWKCNELINDLKLDGSCAKMETIRQHNDLLNKMESKQKLLTSVNARIPEIIKLYENKDIEQIFIVFFYGLKQNIEEQGDNIMGYVNPKYIHQVETIISEYSSQYQKYHMHYIETVSNSEEYFSQLPNIKEMGYNEAKNYLSYFQTLISKINQNEAFPAEVFPILSERQHEIIENSTKVVKSLNDRIKETNPINTIFKDEEITIKQIKEDFVSINGNDDLKSILALDVISYFHKKFSTELQIQMYKESSEYNVNYKALKQKREQTINTVYYSSIQVNTDEYSVKDGCFYLEIGTNKGVAPLFSGMSPTVSHSNEIEGVVHESLPIVSMTDPWVSAGYRNGNKFYRYCIKLPVAKSVAAKIEKKNCNLIICFIPAGIKTYKCMGADYDGRGTYDIFYANKECPFSQKCRVLLFSKSGELLVDRIF